MLHVIHVICWHQTLYQADRPWNAWMKYWYAAKEEEPLPSWADGHIYVEGQKYWLSRFESHETGAYADALRHLLRCEKCREFNNFAKEIIEKELEFIDKEWREAVGYE